MNKDDLEAGESFLAYGLVRYLVAIDGRSFKRMLALIKQGKSEPDALLGALGLTTPQLAREWREAALREGGRR